MGKPSRQDFNIGAVQGDISQVIWNCTKCGKAGSAKNRAKAGEKFDKHDCTDD